MKKLLLPFAAVLVLAACKKTSDATETATLDVTEKNMAVVAKRTATWCPPCGSYGFPTFEQKKVSFGDKAVYMAWKDAFVSTDGSHLFDEVGPKFELGGSVPTFFNNFDVAAGASAVDEHVNAPVIANANYDMVVSGNQVTLKTTTKFFKNVEGTYYMAPYMIVDNIVGNQQGHADGVNTVHHNYVAGIAKPSGTSANKDWGYTIAAGSIKEGYTANLEFTMTRDIGWNESDISFGLIIFKKGEDDKLEFVNAFTK